MRRHRIARLAVLAGIVLAGCTKSGPGTTATSPTDTAAVETPVTNKSGTENESGTEKAGAIAARPVTPAELQALIAQNKGRAVLVDFWATWCVPCVEQYPHTVELSQKYAGDLVVYTVSMDETDDESLAGVERFLTDNSVGRTTPLRSIDGGSEDAYIGFDITGGALPHYKVYGRDGQLAASFGGDVDNPLEIEQVDAAVAAAVGK